MNIDKFNILQEIYDMCVQNRNDENEKLQNNLKRIEDINSYLDTVDNNGDLDHYIFSPRREENIFNDKIKSYQSDKLVIEKNNELILLKIKEYDKHIIKLQQLINNFKSNDFDYSSNMKKSQLEIYDILNIQEKERQRIASELHDSSIQNLTHLIHLIELSSMYISQDPIKAKLELESCIVFLKSIIGEIRDTVFNLRPMTFDDLGFKNCIDNLISNARNEFKNFDIEYHVCELEEDIFHQNDKQKDNLFLVTIYRIVQEAVLNALKHSNGSKVTLNVEIKNEKCYISVTDDGKGFDFNHSGENDDKHFGVSLMRERAELLNGNVSIITEPEKGTKIVIEVPLMEPGGK
ncbi:MAG: sensor histidine kinase [Lachnospiraceae bacterium]|nr:sensor histidine kinase [Lachnospiraceae bacterium]